MLKHLWIYAACLLGSGLSAETIGNIEFEFPPSNYEWNVLADDQFYSDFFGEGEAPPDNEASAKFFTHREGDALEILIASQFQGDDDDDDDQMSTLVAIQKELDETLNSFFPNHRLVALNYLESDTDGFFEWELNDGSVDIMHGYCRAFLEGNRYTALSYLTTALMTDHNRAIWTNTLNQAKVVR